jgi:hypothetical protein
LHIAAGKREDEEMKDDTEIEYEDFPEIGIIKENKQTKF